MHTQSMRIIKVVTYTVLHKASNAFPLDNRNRAACIPLIHRWKKYQCKPHLSCIGCSLTFHFVWQTLIFTSKVLSRRHPTHTYLRGCLFLKAALKGIRGRHTQSQAHRWMCSKVTQRIAKFVECGQRRGWNAWVTSRSIKAAIVPIHVLYFKLEHGP